MQNVWKSLALALPLVAGCASQNWGQRGLARTDNIKLSGQPAEPFSHTQRRRIALVQPWVDAAAYDYNLEPSLINGVIWVESRFQSRATSPAGAEGLMQLMPPTAGELARALGKRRPNSFDPEFNIAAGTLYLRRMLNRYRGDLHKALAAYNAGPGNIDKWTRGGRPLPPRSVDYVTLVLEAKRRFETHRVARAPKQASQDAAPARLTASISSEPSSSPPTSTARPAGDALVPAPPRTGNAPR